MCTSLPLKWEHLFNQDTFITSQGCLTREILLLRGEDIPTYMYICTYTSMYKEACCLGCKRRTLAQAPNQKQCKHLIKLNNNNTWNSRAAYPSEANSLSQPQPRFLTFFTATVTKAQQQKKSDTLRSIIHFDITFELLLSIVSIALLHF